MSVAEVPEGKRFCSQCGEPVGRTRGTRGGRTEGYCPHCRARFSFVPKLERGDMVAGQYEVLGPLAHGGLGWIYLARDKAVSDRWVVLKGLLDAASEDAALAAVAERRFLAAIDHPNIVEIFNFVTHRGAGYIVMEYVGGKSLKTVLVERREANGGRIDPLPVDQAAAYVLEVLPAMGYLHAQGLVYCDMKPDNVMLTADSLKIIDLGGVRRIDDPDAALYGTVGYQAPEVPEDGPSIASDLYTLGRMLAVLVLDFRGYQSTYADSLPPPGEQPLFAEHESLHRFLLKSTARDPADRFTSSDEMSEQLLGVLREAAAARGGEVRPSLSTAFGADLVRGQIRTDWRQLPIPKVDPSDGAAAFLVGNTDLTADQIRAAVASNTAPESTEVLLRLARSHLEAGNHQEAAQALDRITEARDWRLWWYRGLAALADGQPVEALDWLDPVWTELPGESPPKLAVALAAEQAGDLARAAALYDLVSRVDPAYVVTAAFGLARVRLQQGDREAAVEAYRRVPEASSAYAEAHVASVRALVTAAQAPATAGHIDRASAILERLTLDSRRHAELALEVLGAALQAVKSGSQSESIRVLGRQLSEAPVRRGLEETYRRLATLSADTRERVRLIDEANRVRPRTLV